MKQLWLRCKFRIIYELFSNAFSTKINCICASDQRMENHNFGCNIARIGEEKNYVKKPQPTIYLIIKRFGLFEQNSKSIKH